MYTTALNNSYSIRRHVTSRSEAKRSWRNIKRSVKTKTK